MVPTFKLLRDRSKELAAASTTNQVKGRAYREALQQQLVQGAKNYSTAVSDREAVEELVDLIEVVHALLPAHNMTYEELEMVRRRKKEDQGGYTNGTAVNLTKDA